MGGDPILFVATGAVPALVFQYTSRESMKALTVNKPLIYYPQVKTFDIILARFIVEIIKGFTGLILVAIILLCLGIDPVPEFPALSLGGYCAAILFGLGVGSVNIGIMSFFPAWLWGYMLLSILIYVSSGVFFLAHMLPDELYGWMKWNPVVQIIEWVRLGYNPQLGVSVDYYYVLGCGFGSLSAGLVMERIFVRRLA